MTLSTLKSTCAAYLGVTEADLTINSTDLFLVAANNARRNAEQLQDFEYSRIRATLSIDGVTGGNLSEAVIEGNAYDTFTVSGTLSPDCSGVFFRAGSVNGAPLYINQDANLYFLYFTTDKYIIATTVLSSGFPTNHWAAPTLTPTLLSSDFTPQGSYTGTAAVTQTPGTLFTGFKSIENVLRTNGDGSLDPLDFAPSSVAIERTRTEIELSTDYWPEERYRSDRIPLSLGSRGTLVQRNGRIYVYPPAIASTTPLEVTLEGYGWLADYLAIDLTSNSERDFFLSYGFSYLQWCIIIELNYRFKVFVSRQEGNLSSPESMKQEAWRNFLLWDSYQVDAALTRSR